MESISTIIFGIVVLCISSIYAENDPDDHSRDRDGYPTVVKRSVDTLEDDIDQYRSPDPPHPCSDLSGTWYNQQGSELVFEKLPGSAYPITFGGTFESAVHLPTCNDTEKLQMSSNNELRGTATQSGLITFRVIWNKKAKSRSTVELWTPASITTWTGQCLTDGQAKETLYTTWVMTEAQKTYRNLWKANRIGYDTFGRQAPDFAGEEEWEKSVQRKLDKGSRDTEG